MAALLASSSFGSSTISTITSALACSHWARIQSGILSGKRLGPRTISEIVVLDPSVLDSSTLRVTSDGGPLDSEDDELTTDDVSRGINGGTESDPSTSSSSSTFRSGSSVSNKSGMLSSSIELSSPHPSIFISSSALAFHSSVTSHGLHTHCESSTISSRIINATSPSTIMLALSDRHSRAICPYLPHL